MLIKHIWLFHICDVKRVWTVIDHFRETKSELSGTITYLHQIDSFLLMRFLFCGKKKSKMLNNCRNKVHFRIIGDDICH